MIDVLSVFAGIKATIGSAIVLIVLITSMLLSVNVPS